MTSSSIQLRLRRTVLTGPARTAVAVGTFGLLTALGAHVAFPVPGSPVPVTLQTLFVILSGMVLGSERGAASQLAYLGAGIAGAPVFALGAAGPWHLLGPTGGYLLAFPVAAWVAGRLTERAEAGESPLERLGVFLASSLLVLTAGAAWLTLWTGGSLVAGLALGVAPFLPGLLVKGLLAVGAQPVLRRRWVGGED